MELFCFLLFKPLAGIDFNYNSFRAERQQQILELIQKLSPQKKRFDSTYALHPFFGYVWSENIDEVFPPGFPRPEEIKDSDFVIGILGGSVANYFPIQHKVQFIAALQKAYPEKFLDRTIVLLPLSSGGYRQPQQFNYLNFALLSGYRFDLLVSIDGFNEVFGSIDNVAKNINPYFPYGEIMGVLSTKATHAYDPKSIEILYRLFKLYRRQYKLLTLIEENILFRYSPLMNFYAKKYSDNVLKSAKLLEKELADHTVKYTMLDDYKGPAYEGRGSLCESISHYWRQSVLMTKGVADAFNIPYIHILQPTVLLTNTKRLTSEEAQLVSADNDALKKLFDQVDRCYRALVFIGNKLKRQGISFYDLTGVFKDNHERMYADTVHPLPEGYDVLTERIAAIIAYELRSKRM